MIPNKNEGGFDHDNETVFMFYYTTSLSEFFMITYASINAMIYLFPNLSKILDAHIPATRPPRSSLERRRNGIIEITPEDNYFESVLNVRQHVTNYHEDGENDISRYAVAEDYDIPVGRQERLIWVESFNTNIDVCEKLNLPFIELGCIVDMYISSFSFDKYVLI